MDHNSIFTAREIEHLIADPALPLLWDKLGAVWGDDWWRVDDEDDFERAYIERETAIAELEKVVLEICDTAYDEIAQGVAARGSLQDEIAEGRWVIVFDGLSLREACFLKSQLRERGRKAELRYSFSALPSSTEAFCQKHFGVGSLSALHERTYRGLPAVYCPDENAVTLPRAAGGLIAVGLPDPMLHHARRGRNVSIGLRQLVTEFTEAATQCRSLVLVD